MNKTVVIVWIVAVIIFAGIGLFGAANQHLLDEKPATPSTNQGSNTTNSTRTVACIAALPNGSSTYNFTIDNATNNVTNVEITYKASAAVDYIHSSAVNLSSSSIQGITTNLSGGANDFTLLINANLSNYDSTTLANYQNDLTNVLAVIGNYGTYDTYVAAINGAASSVNTVYNCS